MCIRDRPRHIPWLQSTCKPRRIWMRSDAMQIGVSWESYLPGDWPAVLREGGAPLQSKPVGFNREQKLTGRQVGECLAVNLVGVLARGESATFTRDENFHFAIDNFHCNRALITCAGDALFRGEGISD